MHEVELKFQVPPGRRAAVDAAVAGRQKPRRVRLQAAYVDTPGRALARAGIALRVRREGRVWVQTVKGAASDGMTRLEHNVPLGVSVEPPTADPARHAGTAIGDRLAEVLRGDTGGELGVLYRTDILRRARLLRAPGGSLELAFDEGRITAGDSVLAVCEFEIELKGGQARALIETARGWVRRHGLWLDTRSKAERGDLLARGERIAPPRGARAVVLERDATLETVWHTVLLSCVDQIAVNASQVASGEHRDEHVHQWRVGLRRLRSAWRLFEGIVPAAGEEAARDLFQALGGARDEAVIEGAFAAELRQALERAGVGDAPAVASAPSGAPAPVDLARAAATQSLLLDLLAAAREPLEAASSDPSTGSQAPPPRAVLARRLNRWHRRCVADAEQFATLDDAARHRLRKRIKRLRYGVEFTQSLFKREAVKRYLKPLRALQERLGQINDVVMAMDAFRARRDTDPRAWFALGWLAAKRELLVASAKRELSDFADARPFWKRV